MSVEINCPSNGDSQQMIYEKVISIVEKSYNSLFSEVEGELPNHSAIGLF